MLDYVNYAKREWGMKSQYASNSCPSAFEGVSFAESAKY